MRTHQPSSPGRALTGLVLGLALTACAGDLNPINRLNRLSAGNAPVAAVPLNLPVDTQAQLTDFDALTRVIRERYLDPRALEGRDKAIADARARVAGGMSPARFADMLRQTLAALNDPGLELVTATELQAEVAPGGLGLVFAPPAPGAERVLALAVLPGSAADRAGIRAHDTIVRIDQQPVGLATQAELRQRLRGAIGSKVSLSVVSPGQAPREIVVTRAALLAAPAAQARRLPGTNIGYIPLNSGDAADARELIATALRGFASQPIEGLIIDLRAMQSPSFRAYEALELFAHGTAGAIMARDSKQKIEITGKNVAGSQELPLAILVGDQTRGPAESFAGMLQDLGRARLIGARTPGRTEVLASVELPSGTLGLTLPIAEVRGVRDTSWHARGPSPGVRPNAVVDKRFEDYTDDNDEMLAAAIKALGR